MTRAIPISMFLIAAGLTPIIRGWARRCKIVDHPDETALKIHAEPVPLCGGVVLIICLSIGLLAYTLIYPFAKPYLAQIAVTGIASLFVFFVGFKDDQNGLRPCIRLGVHSLSAVLLTWMGLMSGLVPGHIIAVWIAFFLVTGSINAWNFIDGMDGLCASLALISAVGFLLSGYYLSNNIVMAVSAVLCGSLLGLLPYNLFPARIFLGDSGSGLLGLLLSAMVILADPLVWSLKILVAFMLLLGIPLVDFFVTVLRRMVRRQQLFKGDRDHIYDLLLKRGWSQPKVWAALCLIQCLFVLAGLKILSQTIL